MTLLQVYKQTKLVFLIIFLGKAEVKKEGDVSVAPDFMMGNVVIKQELMDNDGQNSSVPVEQRKNFVCTHCQSGFTTTKSLRRHILSVHEGVKKETIPFTCDTCGTTFTAAKSLKRHVEIVHEGIRYQCSICGKSVTSKSSLKDHISAVHDKEKPYVCAMCGFSCARKDYLSHHYKTVHEDQETFQCAECGKTFKQRHSLKKHIISNHENENIKKRFDCPFCPGVFSSTAKHKVVEHCEVDHPNWIDYFKNKNLLLQHVVKIAGGELDPNDDTANLDETYKSLEDVKSEQENETFIGK